MKIVRLKVTNYRGIQALDEAIGPGGAIVSGPNGRGKTSVLRSIQAALAAQDVGPDAIRIGQDRSEILVDLDALRVRRLITKKGTTLTVTTPTAAGDAEVKKPQTMLNELLGEGGIDPLAFFLAKPDERRRIILAAIPTRATMPQVNRWCGPGHGISDTFLEITPGLEVIAFLRKETYDSRTKANKLAKEALAKADAAAADLPPVLDAPPVEVAKRNLDEADRALERLHIQQAQADGAAKALEGNRKRAAERREKASGMLAALPPIEDGARAIAVERVARTEATVAQLETKLAEARALLKRDREALAVIDDQISVAADRRTQAVVLEAEAKELEAMAADVETVTPDALAAADAAFQLARSNHLRAVEAVEHRKLHEVAAGLRRDADAAAAHAAQLDAIVETLTRDAPAELAASGDSIPGLTFEEGGLALDGVLIDKLSGAEQVGLAIEIAKRAAGKARILVVDGLERLDPQTFDHFVKRATEGGEFQLIGTRVAGGEMVIEAITADDQQAEGSAA